LAAGGDTVPQIGQKLEVSARTLAAAVPRHGRR
jgi:hypothetical protein